MQEHSIEERYRQGRRTLQVGLVAFCLWQVPALVKELGGVPIQLRPALDLGGALSCLVWVVCFFRLKRLQAAIAADPVTRAAFNGERIRGLLLKAFNVGFVALIFYLVFLLLGASLVDIPTVFAARLGIVIAAVVTGSAFLIYDRSEV